MGFGAASSQAWQSDCFVSIQKKREELTHYISSRQGRASSTLLSYTIFILIINITTASARGWHHPSGFGRFMRRTPFVARLDTTASDCNDDDDDAITL